MASIYLKYTKSFDEDAVEWSLSGVIIGDPSINRNILLHKVWISPDILNDNKAAFDATDLSQELYPRDSDIEGLVEDTLSGKSFVRAVLPSEIQDYHTTESLYEDLRSRIKSFFGTGGNNKPVSGYFFFLESNINAKFMNYDMLEICANSINAVAKSHAKLYPEVDTIVYPINSSIYYTYPDRLTIGGQTVSGARAGDVIKYRTEGGSGSYTVRVTQGADNVDVIKGRIRIVKDQTATIVIEVSDSNDPQSSTSTITINVEGVNS